MEKEEHNIEPQTHSHTILVGGGDLDGAGLQLELGDIIQILSPNNNQYHNQTYYITYIDRQKIKLINVANFQLETLQMDEGVLSDESITQITLLSRSEEKGYARQNGLTTTTWIDVHFGGEIPAIITGEITNLEEDMIEIRVFPDNFVIYIDFDYKGIPEHIPIQKIEIRDPPSQILKPTPEELLVESVAAPGEEATQTYMENGESVISIPEGAEPEENFREVLHEIYLNANELFGEDLEEVFQKIEISEEERRYGIEKQLNDLIDEMLSTIPISKRSKSILNKIHTLVERFKQMRELYSVFDKNGNIQGRKTYGEYYKPLVDHIINLDQKLNWLIPVVGQTRKIYVPVNKDDAQGISLQNSEQNDYTMGFYEDDILMEREIRENYKTDKSFGDENKYEHFYSAQFRNMTPFTPPFNREDFLAFNKSISADIEALVSNFGEYMSTSSQRYGDSITSTVKFLIQKYNLGYSRPAAIVYQNDKKVYVRKQITPNDSVSVKSLVVMPHSFTTYSRVQLPGTSILEKTSLSFFTPELYRIFNDKRDIPNFTVENLKAEVDYEKMGEDNQFHLFNEITNFVLADDYNITETTYKQFLNTIIPNIRTLIRIIRKNIRGNLSFINIVHHLEQYMIYSNNITYGQYNEIRFFIKEHLLEMKSAFADKFGKYNALKNVKFNIVQDPSKLKKIAKEDEQMNELFKDQYMREDVDMSPSELMNTIIQHDKGALFSSLISSIMLTLVTPNKILDAVNMPDIEDKSETAKKGDCVKRFLAKKYKGLDELQKDNQAEIFVDKELDDTPYGLLDKYKTEQANMLPERFVHFLAENLVQKHDCPRSEADRLAETLISGKKKVATGDFAMVTIKPVLPRDVNPDELTEKEKQEIKIEEEARTKHQYYRRVKDHWVHDTSIDETTFVDTNQLFCNIDFGCMKNPVAKTCDPLESKEIIMKRLQYKRAVEEFDKRFDMTLDELKKELEDALNENLRFIKKQKMLRESLIKKPDLIAAELGKYANTEELVLSPYLKLRDLILGQDDFTKKQTDIVRLVTEFAREALPEQQESYHWYYCKETNTKLFPRSLYELAQAYISDTGHKITYANKLEELTSSIGEISDDGDAIVDKHSGYILQKRDLVVEEQYTEEGFHLVTNAIIEKDIGVVAQEILKKREERDNRDYQDANTNMVYKIFNAICNNMYIEPEIIEPFVIRFASSLINNKKIVLTEDAYNKRVEKLMKEKEKSQPPFTTYFNQTSITIVACATLVAIQTTIPGITAKKTFTGCVRSFGGYPMGGVEDTSGIKYIACVLKGTSSAIKPWDAIEKLSVTMLAKNMRDTLDKVVINDNEVVEMYLKKREYMVLNPDENKEHEHSITKWRHFLPAVVEYTAPAVGTSSAELGAEFLRAMKQGHKSQRDLLNAYKSKNIMHTYAIVETINKIVKEKELLLKTAAKIPFMENACCNEADKLIDPVNYFKEEDKTIDLHIKSTHKNELIINDAVKIARPDILYNDEFTGIVRQELGHSLFEESIYKAFIHYCNFDNDVPIPADLLVVCSEKMAGYDAKMTLKDKIYFLKSHGKKFDEADYYKLMNIVNGRNKFGLYQDNQVFAIEALGDLLGSFDRADFSVIEEPMRVLIQKVLTTYEPMVMIAEGDKAQTPFLVNSSKLKSNLLKTNEKMHKRIMEFMDAYGNLETKDYDNIQTYILGLTKWDIDSISGKSYYDEALYTITNFIKTNVHTLTKVLPSKITNNYSNIKVLGKWGVHKHWDFSVRHNGQLNEIVAKNRNMVAPFLGSAMMNELMLKVEKWGPDVNMFINSIPIITNIKKEGLNYFSLFDRQTTLLLFQYIWYSVIYEYIQMCDEADLIQQEISENRDIRRENREVSMDTADNIVSGGVDHGEEGAEYQAENELLDVNIVAGNVVDLKQMVAKLLVSMIIEEKNNKALIDQQYETIAKRVHRTKQAEKKSFTDFFEQMSRDELNIEKNLKKYKLGRWSYGNDEAVYKYNQEDFDKNAETNRLRLYEEFVELGVNDNIGQEPAVEGVDVEQLDADAEANAEAEYDVEGQDIDGLDENYGDGVYYAEDRDADDFGDD